MSAPKKNKGAQEKLSFSQISQLLSAMGTDVLLSFLTRHFADKRPTKRNSTTIRMSCPVHGDSSPSFDLDTASNTIHCYGCGYHERDFLQFLQDAKGWSYVESAQFVQEQTGARIFSDKHAARMEAVDIHRTAVALIMAACNRYAQDCVTYWKSGTSPDEANYNSSTLSGVVPTLEWLFNERKHDPGLVYRMPYGIWPSANTFKSLLTYVLEELRERNRLANRAPMDDKKIEKVLEKVNQITSKVDPLWTYSVTFHNGHSPNIPGRIRLRRPRSSAKDMNVLEGFDENEKVGFFGLYKPFNPYTGNDLKKMRVLVVEGENDALTFMEAMIKAGKEDPLVIATGGSHGDTDRIYEAGFTKAIMFADDPGAGGIDFIKGRLLTTMELDVRLFNAWHLFRQTGVKDPDDAVQVHGFAKVYKEVLENPANLVALDVWAREQATNDYTDLEDKTDVIAKQRIAADYGKYVRHPALQQQYISDIAKLFEVHPLAIQQEILKRTDTEESFILRIAETIRREYHVTFKEDDGKNTYLTMVHKEKERTIRLPMHDGEAAAIQLANIHGPVTDFFRTMIGLPSFLWTPEGTESTPNLQPIKTYYKDLCNYLKVALQHLFVGVPDRRLCKEFGQGVHYTTDPLDSERKVLYVVNGTAVYKGEYDLDAATAETSPPMTWTKLSGPSEGMYIFNTGFEAPIEPWSNEIKSVDDLVAANDIDITPSLRTAIRLFDTYWHFRHQRLDAEYLGYHLFAAAIPTTFSMMVMASFLGDTHSGKTSILNIFTGVSSKPLQLLEIGVAVSNPTQAAIYQRFNNSTRAIGFDEFEDENDGTHKAAQVANLVVLLRQLVNEEPISIERGGKDGVAKTYNVRTNVFLSGIKQARMIQDMNRRHEIEMNKITGHLDAKQGVLSDMSIEEYQKVRRAVTLGLFKHIPRLAASSKSIEKELLTKQVVPHNVNNRTLLNFVPAATIANFVGDDWRAFVRESCMHRKQKHDAIASETTSQVIYDRVFFTANIASPNNRNAKMSLNELLANPETWQMINGTGAGFFFLPELKLGIVHWITAQTALLHPWAEYATSPHRTLKDAFDRHPNAIRTEDFDKFGVWPHIQRLIPASRKSDVSVVDLRPFIEDARNPSGQAPPAVGVPNPVPVSVPSAPSEEKGPTEHASNNIP